MGGGWRQEMRNSCKMWVPFCWFFCGRNESLIWAMNKQRVKDCKCSLFIGAKCSSKCSGTFLCSRFEILVTFLLKVLGLWTYRAVQWLNKWEYWKVLASNVHLSHRTSQSNAVDLLTVQTCKIYFYRLTLLNQTGRFCLIVARWLITSAVNLTSVSEGARQWTQ